MINCRHCGTPLEQYSDEQWYDSRRSTVCGESVPVVECEHVQLPTDGHCIVLDCSNFRGRCRQHDVLMLMPNLEVLTCSREEVYVTDSGVRHEPLPAGLRGGPCVA